MTTIFEHELGALVLITGWDAGLPTPARVTGRRINENLLDDGSTVSATEYQVEFAQMDGLTRLKVGADGLAPSPAGATWPPSLDEIVAHWVAVSERAGGGAVSD